MRLLVLIVFIWGHTMVYSQSFVGSYSENYSGVVAVLNNPAYALSDLIDLDINYITASGTVDNNYYTTHLKDVFKLGNVDIGSVASDSHGALNDMYVDIDVLGPSAMFKLSPKHGMAVFTRSRTMVNVNQIDRGLYTLFRGGFSQQSEPVTIEESEISITTHTWTELGASFAFELTDKPFFRSQAGITLKYLHGLGNSYLHGTKVQLQYNGSGSVNTSGFLSHGRSQDLGENPLDFGAGAMGVAMDIGFMFEWRARQIRPYRARNSIAITDLGSLKYKAFEHRDYDLQGQNIDTELFDNNDLSWVLNKLYSNKESQNDLKVNLPTALRLQSDWWIINNWFLNFSANMSLSDPGRINTNAIRTDYLVIPRYETRAFTVQSPFGQDKLGQMNWGLGVRIGPFSIGSSNVLSNMVKRPGTKANLFLGLKMGLGEDFIRKRG